MSAICIRLPTQNELAAAMLGCPDIRDSCMPWLCLTAYTFPASLHFTYIHRCCFCPSPRGPCRVAHPEVPLVSFTGGTVTGRRVAATCAPLLKRVSLELGGKNATLIFDDAPLDTVVPGAVRAAFTNNGQVCLCGSRIFVQRRLYDAFLPRFVAAVSALRCGDPSLETTDVGPVSCAVHRDKVVSYIKLGIEEGGTIECGSGAFAGAGAPAGAVVASGGAGAGPGSGSGAGAPPAGLPAHLAGGFFVPPTVISGLSPSSRTATEEIFGPVCTVHPFDSEDEVVAAVNAGASSVNPLLGRQRTSLAVCRFIAPLDFTTSACLCTTRHMSAPITHCAYHSPCHMASPLSLFLLLSLPFPLSPSSLLSLQSSTAWRAPSGRPTWRAPTAWPAVWRAASCG